MNENKVTIHLNHMRPTEVVKLLVCIVQISEADHKLFSLFEEIASTLDFLIGLVGKEDAYKMLLDQGVDLRPSE